MRPGDELDAARTETTQQLGAAAKEACEHADDASTRVTATQRELAEYCRTLRTQFEQKMPELEQATSTTAQTLGAELRRELAGVQAELRGDVRKLGRPLDFEGLACIL